MGSLDAQVGLALYMWGRWRQQGRRLQGQGGSGFVREWETGHGVCKGPLGPTMPGHRGLMLRAVRPRRLLRREVTRREQVPRRQKWQQHKWTSGI